MKMRSRRYVVTAVNKPTKAKLFKDFGVGTVFRCSVELVPTTGASNGLYALEVRVSNLITGEAAKFSQNNVLKYLACFEYTKRGLKD